MCLQAFMQKHTRHICELVDCCLMHELESELVAEIERMPPPRIVVVNAPCTALAEVAAVLDIVKRNFPQIRTVLCGAFPSAFPQHIAEIPWVDFALIGDPEPILRNLLDNIDVEQRLRRAPGLYLADHPAPKPYWLPKLHSLALPNWDDFYWASYRDQLHQTSCRAGIRLTRGHSRAPGDQAYGGTDEPFRQWPLDRVADFVSRCSHTEVREVLLMDPPGFWSESLVADWTQQLLCVRNAQTWGLALHPMTLSEDLIADLRESQCRRVDLVFPTCDRDELRNHDIVADWREIGNTMELLSTWGIQVNPRFWIGGPHRSRGDAARVTQTILRFRRVDYLVEPYPCELDSPLYVNQCDQGDAPSLHDWIARARDPWSKARPVPLWGGESALAELEQELQAIEKTLQKNPHLAWTRFKRQFQSRNWIEVLEEKALALLHKRKSSANG